MSHLLPSRSDSWHSQFYVGLCFRIAVLTFTVMMLGTCISMDCCSVGRCIVRGRIRRLFRRCVCPCIRRLSVISNLKALVSTFMTSSCTLSTPISILSRLRLPVSCLFCLSKRKGSLPS